MVIVSEFNGFYLLPCDCLFRKPLPWREEAEVDPLIRERKSPAGLVSRNSGCEQGRFKSKLGRRRKNKTRMLKEKRRKGKGKKTMEEGITQSRGSEGREGWRVRLTKLGGSWLVSQARHLALQEREDMYVCVWEKKRRRRKRKRKGKKRKKR